MTTREQLAQRLKIMYDTAQGRTQCNWHDLTPERKTFWREFAGDVARELGYRFPNEIDPRYDAALKTLDASDPRLGRDGLNDAIARAIVAALDAKL